MAYEITSTSDNCYPGTTVLVNKLNLKTQDALDNAERIILPVNCARVESSPENAPFTFEYYCRIHKYLFQYFDGAIS